MNYFIGIIKCIAENDNYYLYVQNIYTYKILTCAGQQYESGLTQQTTWEMNTKGAQNTGAMAVQGLACSPAGLRAMLWSWIEME